MADNNSLSTDSHNLASFGRRFLAYSVDQLILAVVTFSLSLAFSAGKMSSIGFLITIGVYLLYFAYFWSKQNGQTLGNRLLAIRVQKEDGKALSMGEGFLRYFGYILAGLPLSLGFLWALWDKNKQGWHDKIAHTVVVRTNEKGHVVLAAMLVIGSWIVTAILIAAFFAVIVLLIKQGGNPASFIRQLNLEEEGDTGFNQSLNDLESNYLKDLGNEVFEGTNKIRENNKLPLLLGDSRLCAYAQRRLEQLSKFGKLDDHKGYYEDTANSQVKAAFFSNFTHTSENYFQADSDGSDLRTDNVLTTWNNTEPLRNKTYTYGCVRSSHEFVVLIVATDAQTAP